MISLMISVPTLEKYIKYRWCGVQEAIRNKMD
jgi:hypothetical protein